MIAVKNTDDAVGGGHAWGRTAGVRAEYVGTENAPCHENKRAKRGGRGGGSRKTRADRERKSSTLSVLYLVELRGGGRGQKEPFSVLSQVRA